MRNGIFIAIFFIAVTMLSPRSAGAMYMEWDSSLRIRGGCATIAGREFGVTYEQDFREWFLNEHEGKDLKWSGTRIYYGWGRISFPGSFAQAITVGIAGFAAIVVVPIFVGFWWRKKYADKLPHTTT